MNDDKERRDISNYVLLGSFLGSLVGTTIVLLSLAESKEELKDEVKDLQRELLEPVKTKFSEMVDNLGETFRKALSEASQQGVKIPKDNGYE